MGLADHTFISDHYTTVVYIVPPCGKPVLLIRIYAAKGVSHTLKIWNQYICSITPAQLLRMLYLVPSSVVLDKIECMHYLLDSL